MGNGSADKERTELDNENFLFIGVLIRWGLNYIKSEKCANRLYLLLIIY